VTGGSRRLRPAAVAGTFYPASPAVLAAQVDRLLAAAARPQLTQPRPKALIVPHAGYVYSGPIAASAYATLLGAQQRYERAVVIGPAHRVPVAGVAVSSADAFATPLGPIPVDAAARDAILQSPGVVVDDAAHAHEHSIEVQLPFLLRTVGAVPVLPLLAGRVEAATVAGALDVVWGGDETLVVVSTDLSHYLDQETAIPRDARTAAAIVARAGDAIAPDDACGCFALRGLLGAAERRGLDVELLDLRTSGDTAGDRDRVVGYGAFALHGP
jgi:hypothetical protein